MANPTKSKAKGKRRKRKTDHPYLARHPEFPLSPHVDKVRGIERWYKVFAGRRYYFGSDPDAALKKFNHDEPYLSRGLKPPPMDDGGSVTVTLKRLADEWLARQSDRVEAGKITASTFAKYRQAATFAADVLGRQTPVTALAAGDFAKLHDKITGKHSPEPASRIITTIKMMFAYAVDADLIEATPRYGKEFKTVSKREKRRQRWSKGRQTYEAAELRTLLDAADVHLRAMICLGVNGGYTQAEVAALSMADIDLDNAIVDHLRGKTQERRTVPLWPETVQAIRESLAKRPTPKDADAKDAVFVTRTGKRWVREQIVEDDDGKERLSRTDAVGLVFTRLCRKHGIQLTGAGFGKLRATMRTAADGAGDVNAARRIMGHEAEGSIDEHYVRDIDLKRLRKVANHVRRWLFGDGACIDEAELV